MKQSKRTRQFFRLFMRHQNRIFAYILTLVPHGADAEDIMQETVSVAWEKFGTFKEGTDFAAWLKKIAFYKVMDHRKRGGHHRIIFSDDLMRVLAPWAEKTFEQTDTRMAALKSCLKRLSSPDRRLLKRRYEDGLTIKAIAEEANRSVQGLYKVMISSDDVFIIRFYLGNSKRRPLNDTAHFRKRIEYFNLQLPGRYNHSGATR